MDQDGVFSVDYNVSFLGGNVVIGFFFNLMSLFNVYIFFHQITDT